jgi:biotin/methionine sulfoxide reductase
VITRSLTHWGLYDFHVENDVLVDVTPVPDDPDPSPIGRNLVKGNYAHRVTQPSVRKGFLDGNKSSVRGEDEFVNVTWDEALDLVASELGRVKNTFGNTAIYGGSYGWASAGRFHHALSQLHRFLSCIGGFTESVNAYSFAAAEVILPHVIGRYDGLLKAPTSWPEIIDHCELMVCFGGMPLRNSQITNGGMGKHVQRDYMHRAKAAGVNFVNIGPIRSDNAIGLGSDWVPTRPGTDVALMLGLAFELYTNNLHDTGFLERYCSGFEEFEQYLTGTSDNQPKTPEWASTITGIPSQTIRALAHRMAKSKTMITLAWSLSRHQHGEQPYWMGITLAAMLGQIGLPGTGIGLGYGVENKIGKNVAGKYLGHFPRPPNPVNSAIPVARITDMLERPGQPYRYNNAEHSYPDIRLIYWAGGNPFHHHQDLNRLKAAWQRPETVICHELVWNSTALHSDIVLPVASFLERNDIGGAPNEDILVAMKQALPPLASAWTDYEIFSRIAERLEVANVFTEGKSEEDWIRSMYQATIAANPDMPDFDTFWANGIHEFQTPAPHNLFSEFRRDPEKQKLDTTDGRIMISHEAMGHPVWHEPGEWLGNTGGHPFHLISHQPQSRLHSQLYHGETSQSEKISGLAPLGINPIDATASGFKDGDKVRVFNARGAFYAGINIDGNIMQGILSIATGAWWDPDEDGVCRNGNPNAVTQDIGTSELAQGPSALTCMVSIAKVVVDQVNLPSVISSPNSTREKSSTLGPLLR